MAMAADDRDDRGDAESRAAAGTRVTTPPTTKAVRVSPAVVFRWATMATLGVLTVLLAAYSLYIVRSVLMLILLALFLAVSLDPAVQWLLRRGVNPPWTVTLFFLVVVLLFLGFLGAVWPSVLHQS